MAIPGNIIAVGRLVSPGGEPGSGGGVNAFTDIASDFTVPAIGADIDVTVTEARWIVEGQIVYVGGAGEAGEAGCFRVAAIVGNILTLTNIEVGVGGGGGIGEAPIDGKQYARQDADWTEVAAPVLPRPVIFSETPYYGTVIDCTNASSVVIDSLMPGQVMPLSKEGTPAPLGYVQLFLTNVPLGVPIIIKTGCTGAANAECDMGISITPSRQAYFQTTTGRVTSLHMTGGQHRMCIGALTEGPEVTFLTV
jgi:hypothetical protein